MLMMNGKQGVLRGLLLMSILTSLVAATCGALNWLSASLQDVTARQYTDIDEARRSIGFSRISVPSYFPEGIAWPPSFLLGQKKPFPALVMEFRAEHGSDIALIITQSARGADARAMQRLRLNTIQEETAYTIKEQQALLQVGRCTTGRPCSQMSWLHAGMQHTVLFMGPPFELIRLAESMIH